MRVFPCFVLVHPATDIEGEWVAHCLDYDVVSQGNSLEHALDMVIEATRLVLDDDVRSGREPAERRAPSEMWEPAWKALDEGEKTTLEEASERADGEYLFVFELDLLPARQKPPSPRVSRLAPASFASAPC